MVSTSVGDLSGIWISGGYEAVLIRGCGTAEYLVGCFCVTAWLREVMVFHIYDEDMFEGSAFFDPLAIFDPFNVLRHCRLCA